MRADEPHRLPRRRAQGRQAEALDDRVEDRLRRLAGMDHAGGDAERPRRSRNQERRRFDVAVEPAAGGELVLDQAVGGRGVGHAQQRLGEHHEREPLLGGERVGVQKVLDAAEPSGFGADRLDQGPRPRVDAAFGGAVAGGSGEEARREFLIGRRERRAERRQRRLGPGHRSSSAGRRRAGINNERHRDRPTGSFRLRFMTACSLSDCGRTAAPGIGEIAHLNKEPAWPSSTACGLPVPPLSHCSPRSRCPRRPPPRPRSTSRSTARSTDRLRPSFSPSTRVTSRPKGST